MKETNFVPGIFFLGSYFWLIFKEWKSLDEFREMVSAADIVSIEDSTYK
jgi:hypothetical protein